MKKFLFLSLPIFLLFITSQAKAQNYQLHAVFVNSFIKYIKWPESQSVGNFKIAVLGDSPVIEHLKVLADRKKVDGRDIIVKQVANLDEASGYHMLYIPKENSAQLSSILAKYSSTSTLIITEEEGLGAQGSNINFINNNGRLAFEMNLAAMEKSNLKVATELARLAIEI